MLSYTEGVIESIEEEGILKKAKEDGSEEKKDAIFMEKIVHFRNALGDLCRFIITNDKFKSELKVGQYYYVFSEGENIKEIYKDERGLTQRLEKDNSQENQAGESNTPSISENVYCFFVIAFFCFMFCMLEFCLAGIAAKVILYVSGGLSTLKTDLSVTQLLLGAGAGTLLNFLGLIYLCNKGEKKDLRLKNKLVADFREEMKINSKNKDISSDVVLPEKVAVLNQ